MGFMKICTDCGNEFETDKLYDDTLICSKCGSGDIDQIKEYEYDEITLEDCFLFYHENKIVCMLNADKKQVLLMEE